MQCARNYSVFCIVQFYKLCMFLNCTLACCGLKVSSMAIYSFTLNKYIMLCTFGTNKSHSSYLLTCRASHSVSSRSLSRFRNIFFSYSFHLIVRSFSSNRSISSYSYRSSLACLSLLNISSLLLRASFAVS